MRGLRRSPGFISLAETANGSPWYGLAFEVEGGSTTDAADAAEEQLVDYLDALSRYRPQVWAPLQIEARSAVRSEPRSDDRSEVGSRA